MVPTNIFRSKRLPAFLATAFAPLLATGLWACVDTKGEVDRYLADTDSLRGAGVEVDAGAAIDAEVPEGGFEGTFFVQCLPKLALGAVKTSFKFKGAVTFTPTAGGGGKVASSLTPLDKAATKITDEVGAAIPLPETVVAADGKFDLKLGSVTVPGQANPLSGNPVQIENGAIVGILQGSSSICGELNGQITSPIQISIDDPGDICLYREMAQGAVDVPQLVLADFHCP
ncbi:MAG: hypothetical protein U0169_13535 [Polyangiaceae bacterium]